MKSTKLAGIQIIPAFIRLANDQEMLEFALVENIQRKDLDPIEIALSYKRLIEEVKLTQEELSSRIGKDRSTISNYLRILNLDPVIQRAIRESKISMGHGKALISINNKEKQLHAFRHITNKLLSVRDAEEYVKQLLSDKKTTQKGKSVLPVKYASFQKEFSNKLGRKVEIKKIQGGNGKLVIHFNNDKDFDLLCSKIISEDS